MDISSKVIVVCGPTASGKTSLSLKIATHFGAEIVSADSMQIYREMNIGTAKPTSLEKGNIPHHMMDIVSVTEDYNVSRYVIEAGNCIDSILRSGKTAVVVGGTGLYIDNLINNTDFLEIENDFDYRCRLKQQAEQFGGAYLKEKLYHVDPVTADRLHENDIKRIIRALEVYHVTGKPLSKLHKLTVRDRKYDTIYIGLNYNDREILYDRIERRVDLMIQDGLIDEARDLSNKKLSHTASAAIGYSDIFDYLNDIISLEQAIQQIKQKTRRYAKRQLTWFRRNSEIKWFYPDLYNEDDLFADVIKYICKETE